MAGKSKGYEENVIDATLDDTGGIEIPVKLLEFCRKWHGKFRRVQCQFSPMDREDWKMVPGYWRVPHPANPSPEEIAVKAMELAGKHAEEHFYSDESEELRYRGYFIVVDVNGQERPKRCSLRAKMGADGSISFSDDEDIMQEKETLSLFREVMQDAREEKKQMMDFMLERERVYGSTVSGLGEEVQNIAGQIAALTSSLGEVAKAATGAITQASELYKASELRSAEIRKLELEAEQVKLEQESADRKFDGAMNLIGQAAPLLLAKLLKIEPEVMMAMMLGAQGGDMGGMMEQMKSLGAGGGGGGGEGEAEKSSGAEKSSSENLPALQWEVPDKPRGFDPGERSLDELDLREKLSMFFHNLSDDQERKTRTIVGGDVYDTIRIASNQDESSCTAAIQKLNAEIKSLQDTKKGKLAKELIDVLGKDMAMFFLGLTREVS